MTLTYTEHGLTRTAEATDECRRCDKTLKEHSPMLRLCDTGRNDNLNTFSPKNHNGSKQ